MVLCESLDGSIECSYCTPMDVVKAIRMVDYYSQDGELIQPSDSSLPDWDELCFRITVAERYIDRYTGRTWRENRVKNEIHDINTYWHDENARRIEYWLQGGYFVQLERNLLPFDPYKGDKVEIRNLSNQWVDISTGYQSPDGSRVVSDLDHPEYKDGEYPTYTGRFWFDCPSGKLYLQSNYLQPKQHAIRVTYRYGDTEEVPADIKRACALKVGLTMLQEDLYMTKIGQGGDLGSSKSDLQRAMQEQINEIILANRTYTAMFSSYD